MHNGLKVINGIILCNIYIKINIFAKKYLCLYLIYAMCTMMCTPFDFIGFQELGYTPYLHHYGNSIKNYLFAKMDI